MWFFMTDIRTNLKCSVHLVPSRQKVASISHYMCSTLKHNIRQNMFAYIPPLLCMQLSNQILFSTRRILNDLAFSKEVASVKKLKYIG